MTDISKDGFPVWRCSKGHTNDMLTATCRHRTVSKRCTHRTPCPDHRLDNELTKGRPIELSPVCGYYLEYEVCAEYRPCAKCGLNVKPVRMSAYGDFCDACRPKSDPWPFSVNEVPKLIVERQPIQPAIKVPAIRFKNAASLAVLLNSKHGFVYDVQHAIGPEPERVQSVAMRIRRPDGMRAVVIWGGENISFNRAIVRDSSGWGTLNLTDFKRWCGFEIYRKARAATTRTKVSTQKLKDTMR